MKKNEFDILNVLRGMSALFVLFYHYFVFFFAHQTTSANLLQIDAGEIQAPFYLEMIENLPFDIGHLGVSFFFLISGFLILPSLQRYPSVKAFLFHKVVRLWPTFAISFLSGLIFVLLFYSFYETPFPYETGHVLACLFWVRDIFHYPFIDGAVWSLEVQLKFYLLAALVWHLGQKNFLEKMCAIILIVSAVVYGLYLSDGNQDTDWYYLILVARRNLKFFILILLGSGLYALYKKQISWPKALILGTLLLLCFLSPLFTLSSAPLTTSYLLGFFAFSGFIFFLPQSSGKERVWHKFINWVSTISYPLYIGHVLPGYVLMYFMIFQGWSVYWGILLALLYVFFFASFVHKKIELYFLSFPKASPSTLNEKIIPHTTP